MARRSAGRGWLAVEGLGLAGLIPFLAPAVLAIMRPAWRPHLAQVETVYAAAILAFLGGARFGGQVESGRPRAALVAASMAPPLLAYAVLSAPLASRAACLALLAGLALMLGFDLASKRLDARYKRLRILLTTGAALSLIIVAVLV